MPSLSLTRVNQKLAQARALLQVIDESALTPLSLNSIQEAVAFHLICAYQHYLCEIAEVYWLKNVAAIRTESDLITAFYAAKKHPAEAEELLVLRTEKNSWLAQLHIYYESLWLVPVITLSDTQQDDRFINVVNLESNFDVASVDLALIDSWHLALLALITRQRQTSAEF